MKGSYTDKTNVIRILEKEKIPFRTASYEVDENDLSATHAAQLLGVPQDQVFKTLVLRGEKNGPFVCCIAGQSEVDLKKAAKLRAEKKVEMLPLKELEPLTGYVRGGCSPLGMKKALPVFLDAMALLHPEISISAGRRGLQVLLSPQDLLSVSGAQVADIVQMPNT